MGNTACGTFHVPHGTPYYVYSSDHGLMNLLPSLAINRTSHTVGIIGIVVAVAGLASSVLSTGGEFAGSSLYLGLGVGGAERLASYPGSLWMLMIGIIAMFSARTWRNFTAGAGARSSAATVRPATRPAATPARSAQHVGRPALPLIEGNL